MEKTKKIDFGSELDHAKEEAKAWKTIWSAGQGVTSISDVKPVAELISQLKVEFEKALLKQKKIINTFFNFIYKPSDFQKFLVSDLIILFFGKNS